jgi:hypothetical protein
MRYSLTNFVTAALGVFACAIALGVLTVPAWAITARVLVHLRRSYVPVCTENLKTT